MSTAREDLIEARATLLRDGWCQGQFKNQRGEHCLIGALSGGMDGIAYKTLTELSGIRRIARWNDSDGRTVDEVLELLDTVIAEQEKDENAHRAA